MGPFSRRRRERELDEAETARLVLAGVVVGAAAALLLTRFMGALLFEVRPTDPASFAAMSLLLLATALFASWLPARRAARADPHAALRCN